MVSVPAVISHRQLDGNTAVPRDDAADPAHTSILVGGRSVEDSAGFVRTASMGQTLRAEGYAATADSAMASVRAAVTPCADAGALHLDAAVRLLRAAAP